MRKQSRRELIWKKPTKIGEKTQMAKEITKLRKKIKDMTNNVTELHRLKGGEELALATLQSKHDELLQTVSNCKHQ